MTANAMKIDRERCLEAGMNDHVPKPIDPEELWKALLKWIKPRFTAAALKQQVKADDEFLSLDIKELDIAEGLRHVRGKKLFYLSLLQKFINGQEDIALEIQKCLKENDLGTAERLAHTLKSVSANIGAHELAPLAEKLESVLREHQAPELVEQHLSAIIGPLKNLIQNIKLKLPREVTHKTVLVDELQLKDICSQLIQTLGAGDAEAVELLNRHSDILNSAFPHEFERLNQQIQNFDFPGALTTLNSLLSNHLSIGV
jgi:two-component system sensor histidine kinase/response regulator